MDLWHLALRHDWDGAQRSGSYRISSRGVSLDDVGFIHASFPQQLEAVARQFYADVTEDLVVLVLDEEELTEAGTPVRMEPADPADGSSELYPHVYGPIPLTAVAEVRAARFDDEGGFQVDGPAEGGQALSLSSS